MRGTLNAPWLLTNRQFQWTGNGHSQLPMTELGKPSPNIDLLHTTCSNGIHFSLFNLDLWPTTLTYNPRLAKIKVDPHASGERPQTNVHTHGCYQTYHLPCYAVNNYGYSVNSFSCFSYNSTYSQWKVDSNVLVMCRLDCYEHVAGLNTGVTKQSDAQISNLETFWIFTWYILVTFTLNKSILYVLSITCRR